MAETPHKEDSPESAPETPGGYRIGIDAGSKTIKVVLCDDAGTIVHSEYRRHQSDIKTTLKDLLHDLTWRYGDIHGTIGVTGSAGIGLANTLQLPFIQEVVATTKIVRHVYPQADAVIELGGEDAKVIYLTGGLEQRMNGTCAGGTGAFIDNVAYLLGVKSDKLDTLSMGASRVYPIASRCAVFAQTDLRPLMNAGAKVSDLAASAMDAVVRQTIGGLACGRPIQGTVVFLGGPCQFFPHLVHRFRRALNLNDETGIRPADAQLFTARGAALFGAEQQQPTWVSFPELLSRLDQVSFSDGSIPRLAPLFERDHQLREFVARHKQAVYPRGQYSPQLCPVYLGIDAGSTTVKMALLNEQGELLYSDYQENKGDVLGTAAEMLQKLYQQIPRSFRGEPRAYIAHAVATGYGEDLLRAGLGVDSGVVETTAHVQAALQFEPNATFVLDIGGQDMKAIWVKDGLVHNAVLNEACSSGCGSFISGTAHSLKLDKNKFSDIALTAKAPVDLGTKCTVFMSSRVKHAQKSGATKEDLAAGCAYSVVKNALYRIIGIHNIDSLGDKIVVQGGTFMNMAILRAFELESGKQVIRPDRANLMGAIGAALVARQRGEGIGPEAASSLLTREQLEHFAPKRSTRQCEGCSNQCVLSLVKFGEGRAFVGGNKCSKGLEQGDKGFEPLTLCL